MSKSPSRQVSAETEYAALLSGLIGLLEKSRRSASRAINSVLTLTCWEIGRRIFVQEQKGKARTGYEDQLLDLLARDLSARFGRGCSRANVFQMRQFYVAYREKVQTVSGKFTPTQLSRCRLDN